MARCGRTARHLRIVDSAGEVADGEIITIPLGLATFCKHGDGDSRAVAADDGIDGHQPFGRRDRSCGVDAGRITPYGRRPAGRQATRPLSLTSLIASSAPSAMGPVNDSIGPVKPSSTPSLTSSANAAPSGSNDNKQATIRFITSLLRNYRQAACGVNSKPSARACLRSRRSKCRRSWRSSATRILDTALSCALGVKRLELVHREASVGPFSCDILARAVDSGVTVAIENQLESSLLMFMPPGPTAHLRGRAGRANRGMGRARVSLRTRRGPVPAQRGRPHAGGRRFWCSRNGPPSNHS